MRRILSYIIIIFACFLLQCTIFRWLSIGDIAPNLMIVVTASIGVIRGKKEGLFVGFACGLLMDLMFGNVLGFYALVYMFLGFINGIFHARFFTDQVKLPISLIAISDMVLNLVTYFILFFFRGRFEFGYYFGSIIVPGFVYTMAVSILLYAIILKVSTKLEEYEQRSKAKFV